MIRRSLILLIICLCLGLLLSSNTLWADTGIKVLIYTGKIEITNAEGVATTFAVPQEVTAIPSDSTAKCLDGVAIFEIGNAKLMLEATDAVKFSKNDNTGEIEMTCINGEIQVTREDNKMTISKDQKLALSLSNVSSFKTAKDASSSDTGTYQARSKLAIPPFVAAQDEPIELPHASPYK